MKSTRKSQSAILSKLGIEALNEMQEQAALAIDSVDEVILLSPTGSGKTLAFLLPLITILDEDIPEVQAMIIVPSRELAIQIEQVALEIWVVDIRSILYMVVALSPKTRWNWRIPLI